MSKKKVIKMNFVISGLIIVVTALLSIPCAFLDWQIDLDIFTWVMRIDVFYFIISFILFIISLDIKIKPRKKKSKTTKTKTVGYYYYHDDQNTTNQDSTVNHNASYKNIDDRMYEEAVRYYGKSYAMGRSKQDLIDDYMNEK